MAIRKYIRGKEGRVEVGGTDLEVTQFEYTSETDMETIASSVTNGKKVNIKGNAQASGTIQGKLSAEQVISDLMKDGDTVALKLFLTKSATGTNKKIYLDAPECDISSIQFASDPNGGGGATFQAAFSTSGDYDYKHES